MKLRNLFSVILCTVLICLAGSTQPVYAAEQTGIVVDGVIADGVMIDSLDVGGMTVDEARDLVSGYFDRYKNGSLVLSFNGAEEEITFAELGIEWDNPEIIEEAASLGKSGNTLQLYKELTQLKREDVVLPIEYSLDESLVEEFLTEQALDHETEPVNASISRSGSGFTVTQSVTGLTVDIESTMDLIMDKIQTEWDGGRITVEAVTEVTEPKYTTETLSLIKDCLGDYSTSYNAGKASRSQNLVNGTNFINGVVLLPGESMSLYDYLAPYTEANGYATATAYADGGYVDSVGGGVCQISTTLYNALLEAELKVLTRSPHSLLVDYVEPGFDSAQSGTSKDLSFMNDTDYPVYIEAWASGGTLYAAVWGRDDRPSNRTVRYYNNIVSRTGAGEPVYTEDPSLPAGTQVVDQNSYDAVTAELYKEVSVDGVVVETTLMHTDRYQSSPAKVRVGTMPVETEEAEEEETESEHHHHSDESSGESAEE